MSHYHKRKKRLQRKTIANAQTEYWKAIEEVFDEMLPAIMGAAFGVTAAKRTMKNRQGE